MPQNQIGSRKVIIQKSAGGEELAALPSSKEDVDSQLRTPDLLHHGMLSRDVSCVQGETQQQIDCGNTARQAYATPCGLKDARPVGPGQDETMVAWHFILVMSAGEVQWDTL